jgi:tetratricopeptide (TPR) repeat protein
MRWQFFLMAAVFAGCAPQARLMVLRPAEIDLTGIQRLAIAPVTGKPEGSTLAREQLAAALSKSPSYALVDLPARADVQQASFTEGSSAGDHDSGQSLSEPILVESARQAGADAVLLARIVHYDTGSASSAGEAGGGLGRLFGPSQLTLQPPRVTLQLRLVDAQTGNLTAEREISKTHRSRDAVDGEAMRQELLARCIAELSQTMTAHYEPLEVELARQWWGNGLSAQRRGNSLALADDWPGAEAAWQEALTGNPRNHAALHNLAIAAFARGDMAQSRQLLERALAVYADVKYHQTRQLLEAEHSRQQAQRQQAQVPSSQLTASPIAERLPLP